MSGAVAGAVVSVLAQAPPGSERGEEFGKTSPIALVVILLLGLATVLLIRSMGKHLRKVPASFDEPATTGSTATTESTEPPTTEDGGADRTDQPTATDGARQDGKQTDRP